MIMSTTFLTAKFTWAAILLWFDFFMKPSLSLMGVVMATVAIDFITGVIKARMQRKARTSTGYRKTLTKLSQYIVPVVVLYGASYYIPEYTERLRQASGFVMLFIIYIEVTSIFENLYSLDQKTPISKYMYKPVLTILKFGIEHNPVVEAAENIQKTTTTTEVKIKEKTVTETMDPNIPYSAPNGNTE